MQVFCVSIRVFPNDAEPFFLPMLYIRAETREDALDDVNLITREMLCRTEPVVWVRSTSDLFA